MSDQQPDNEQAMQDEARKRQRRKRATAVALTALAVFVFAAGVLGALLILNGVPGVLPAPGASPGDISGLMTVLAGINATYGLYPDSVSPSAGPATGGTSVTIIGTDGGGMFDDDLAPGLSPNLDAASAAAAAYFVYFDGILASFDVGANPNAATPTTFSVVTPPHQPGLVDVFLYYTAGTLTEVDDLYANLADGFLYTSTLASIYPTRGYIRGDLPVTLTGRFLSDVSGQMTAAQAEAIYSVYFEKGGNRLQALFDPAFDPAALTGTQAHVLSPLLPTKPLVISPGLVDVTFEDLITTNNAATLYDAFDYVAIEILSVTPSEGTTAGGTPVTITGYFSMQYESAGGTDITTSVAATAAYRVYFEKPFASITPGNLAPWDPAFDGTLLIEAPPTPFLSAQNMYVITPPHAAGFVDVHVMDVDNTPPIVLPPPLLLPPSTIQDTLVDSYEYTDSAIGDWVGLEVIPEFIGNSAPGEVTIKIETTTFPADPNEIELFVAPQGADPTVVAESIRFTRVQDPTAGGSGNLVTVYENADPISTILIDTGAAGPSTGDLFNDGHAAIYIYDNANMILYGNDTIDLTDGGRIQNLEQELAFGALERRHVIIDTIPPVMVVSNPAETAPDLVVLNSGLGTLGAIVPAPAATFAPDGNTDHPVPIPVNVAQDDFAAPSDDGEIVGDGVNPPYDRRNTALGRGAQFFANPGSFANDFPIDNLDVEVTVEFFDFDLHTYYGIAPDAVRDEDQFEAGQGNAGFTFRQPSGWDPDPVAFPLNTPDVDLDVTTQLIGDQAPWAQWRLGPNSDRWNSSAANPIQFNVEYQNASGSQNSHTITILDSDYLEDLTVIWDFDTTNNPGGIPELDGDAPLHLEVFFRAHDRAGQYMRGFVDDNPPVVRREYTREEALLEPLHIWWLRNTGARIVPNLEGQTVIDRDVTFRLDREYEPNATSDAVLLADATNPIDPLVSYRLWVSTEVGQEGYNAPYQPLGLWTVFNSVNSAAAEINTEIDIAEVFGNQVRNRWVLITAVAIDEAGNYGQVPDVVDEPHVSLFDLNEIEYDAGADNDPNTNDDQVTAFPAASGASWMRIFIGSAPENVNTRVQTTYWYDDNLNDILDAGEDDLPGAQRIVQEPKEFGQELRFQFDVSPEIAGTAPVAQPDVEWVVRRDGQTVANGLLGVNNFEFDTLLFGESAPEVLDLFTIPAGEPTRFQFVFTAIDNDTGERDPTPVIINTTIVRDIEEYFENTIEGEVPPVREVSR